jgi:hypothetical protein
MGVLCAQALDKIRKRRHVRLPQLLPSGFAVCGVSQRLCGI